MKKLNYILIFLVSILILNGCGGSDVPKNETKTSSTNISPEGDKTPYKKVKPEEHKPSSSDISPENDKSSHKKVRPEGA
jgi:PBP1b-binding outer membrane lipoprotein LpoB